MLCWQKGPPCQSSCRCVHEMVLSVVQWPVAYFGGARVRCMLPCFWQDFSAARPMNCQLQTSCNRGLHYNPRAHASCCACCCQQGDVEVAQARIHQLQEELASKEGQLRYKLNANELQLKEQIVYNVRTAVAGQVTLVHRLLLAIGISHNCTRLAHCHHVSAALRYLLHLLIAYRPGL